MEEQSWAVRLRRPLVLGDMHRTLLMSSFSLRWRPQVTVIDLANNSGHVPADVPIRITRLDMRDDHLSGPWLFSVSLFLDIETV